MPDRAEARTFLERQALDARNRAEEYRTVGENTRSPEARAILLRMAAEADQTASQIEAQVATLKSS